MQGRRYWVEQGEIGAVVPDGTILSPVDERKKLEAGQVRVTTGDLGTEVKWYVQSPCYASLFATLEWLSSIQLPIVLRFYASGWFEEFHKTNETAMHRLNDIISRGDRHFSSRTMVKEFDIKDKPLPTLLTECINKPNVALDYAIECSYEETTEQFAVQRIGSKSVINQVWGPFPSSFPCQSTSQYGQTVSEAYHEVLNTGKPRYDHVLAAMRMPDNVVFWVPYHRLVMPKTPSLKKQSVLVVAELNQVDIQLI